MLVDYSFDVTGADHPVHVSPRHGTILSPNISAYPSHKPGIWSVCVGVIGSGFTAHFDAVINDFGDLVRTSTSPAAEDETDLSRVRMQLPMFAALVRGYLASARCFLTPREKELLPFAGKLITFEIGLRFLTDWLEGDTYFKIKRPTHNLDRCRTQFKLVASIEEQLPAMREIVEKA